MKVKFKQSKIMQDGDSWLCLKITNLPQAREFIDNIKDTTYQAEIKEYREKRSLNANAYCWALIGKIADTLRTSKDAIYLQMLKRYGQSQIVSVVEAGEQQFKRAIKYYDDAGESTLNGKVFKHIKCYAGSSEYDTREMSILIDGIVSECKEMNINTATPDELDRMKREWNA